MHQQKRLQPHNQINQLRLITVLQHYVSLHPQRREAPTSQGHLSLVFCQLRLTGMLLHPIILCVVSFDLDMSTLSFLLVVFVIRRASTSAVSLTFNLCQLRTLRSTVSTSVLSTCTLFFRPVTIQTGSEWRLCFLTPPWSHLSLLASLALHRWLPQTSTTVGLLTSLTRTFHLTNFHIFMCVFELIILVE